MEAVGKAFTDALIQPYPQHFSPKDMLGKSCDQDSPTPALTIPSKPAQKSSDSTGRNRDSCSYDVQKGTCIEKLAFLALKGFRFRVSPDLFRGNFYKIKVLE